MSFAHLWYAKLNLDEYGKKQWWPPELFNDYVREFSELADRQESSAAPEHTLEGLVRKLLVTARDQLK